MQPVSYPQWPDDSAFGSPLDRSEHVHPGCLAAPTDQPPIASEATGSGLVGGLVACLGRQPSAVGRRINGEVDRRLHKSGLVELLEGPGVGDIDVDPSGQLPELSDDYVRIATWNLRHINLEGDAEDLLPGNTEEEDFAILTATFAKAIQDLGLDVVAVVEHQPRQNESNRLH